MCDDFGNNSYYQVETQMQNILGPLKLLIIQSTSFCNLDCSYCYLPNRDLQLKFNWELIEPIFTNILTSKLVKHGFTVVWHAGEPLTVAVEEYRAAMEKITQLKKRYQGEHFEIDYNFQTNGTLIDQKWCDLFKNKNVRVGVSLDGPEFIHDRHRLTKKGLGSHPSTMRGISLLQENNIDFHVISVLTKHSLDYPEEIFTFFEKHNISQVGFNIEEIEDYNYSSSLGSWEEEQRFRQFITKFYQLTQTSSFSLRVREFEYFKNLIYSGQSVQIGQFTPLTMISVDYQGNFMTYSPELLGVSTPEYGLLSLGNLAEDSLDKIQEQPKFKQIQSAITTGVTACQRDCEYFEICGGGSPGNKYFENGSFSSTETMYCRYTKKIIFNVVLEEMEKTLGLREK